jgi:hypothetical protein
MRIFLLYILLSITASLNAQGGFKKKYFPQNSLTSVSTHVMEAPGGNLIAIGITQEVLYNKLITRLTFILTDPQGNFLWKKSYGDTNLQYSEDMNKNSVVVDSNCFYLTLTVADLNSKQKGALLKLNFNCDTIWQKLYGDSNGDIHPLAITKSVDGGFLITGCHPNSATTLPVLILKTDMNGNELWRKYINKPNPNIQLCASIKQDSATKKIIAVGYQFLNSTNDADFCSNILILDSLGNKVFQTSFNNGGGGGFVDVIQLKDKNFLTCGSWAASLSSDYNPCKSILVKFDISGNVIWSLAYPPILKYNTIAYLQELSDENLIMMGRIDSMPNVIGPVKSEIIKTDKFGHIKWKREIGSAYIDADSTYLYDFEACRSLSALREGGFVLPSWFPYSPNPRPYSIIKVDGTGCDTTEAYCKGPLNVGIKNLEIITGFRLNVFPNPSNDVLNIKVNAPAEKSFEIRIVDVSSREIETKVLKPEEELQINTENYKAGVYFVHVLYNRKLVETRKLVVSH